MQFYLYVWSRRVYIIDNHSTGVPDNIIQISEVMFVLDLGTANQLSAINYLEVSVNCKDTGLFLLEELGTSLYRIRIMVKLHQFCWYIYIAGIVSWL